MESKFKLSNLKRTRVKPNRRRNYMRGASIIFVIENDGGSIKSAISKADATRKYNMGKSRACIFEIKDTAHGDIPI